jgi:hypothetical protein
MKVLKPVEAFKITAEEMEELFRIMYHYEKFTFNGHRVGGLTFDENGLRIVVTIDGIKFTVNINLDTMLVLDGHDLSMVTRRVFNKEYIKWA